MDQTASQLRAICGSREMFDEAIEYYQSSIWSMPALIEYISFIGRIPIPEYAKYPVEVLAFMRLGLLKFD